MRKQLEQKEQRLQAVEGNIEALQHNISEHQAELRSELHNHLSAVERQELGDLTPRLKMLQVALSLSQLIAQTLRTAVQLVYYCMPVAAASLQYTDCTVGLSTSFDSISVINNLLAVCWPGAL